ncbi:MAG TPA: HAD hydrolase-like protein, partial [Blastocatellia bacterium]|nr:HAD hydrolase-like protein [Blastocatellia bacterium]
MDLDCFIFDFDGTLARSETAYRSAFCHALRRHLGVEVPGDSFRDFWNLTPGDVLSQYVEDSPESLARLLASFEEHYYS